MTYLWLAIALLVCAALVWIAGARGAGNLRPRERVLELPGLPAQLDGLRLMHLSDLHFRRRSKTPDRLLQVAREHRPDLIVITGDLVWGRSGLGVAEEFLRALAAQFPVWAVEGNADHWADRTGEARRRWCRTGARILANAAAPLGDKPAWVVGSADPYRRRDDLQAAYRAVPAGAWTILLAHSPDIVLNAKCRRAGVIFAGHTHGGQVRLPGLGALFTHTRVSQRFAEGVHRLDGTVLVVSRGVGVTRLPIRLWCPPEVTTWRLTAIR